MLRNEKYMGDVLLQKTYVKDFLTGRQVENDRDIQQYLVREHHEGIISPELFLHVQQAIQSRSNADKFNAAENTLALPSLDPATRISTNRLDDHMLCIKSLSGNTQAGDMLFERIYPYLRKYVFYLTKGSTLNYYDKEDIVHNSLLRAWQYRYSFNGQYRFITWVRRIAYHECYRYYAAQKKHGFISTDLIEQMICATTRDIEQMLDRQLVIALLNVLTKEQQEIVIRRIWGEEVLENTIREKDWGRSTASAKFQRALEKMREIARQ